MQLWIQLWCKLQISDQVAELWTQQVIALKDCGQHTDLPEDHTKRKLRPIALEEAPVKFSESAAIDALGAYAYKSTEPWQLGSGTPDGSAITIQVLQAWAHHAGDVHVHEPQEPQQRSELEDDQMHHLEDEADSLVEDLDIIWSTDLSNAYGRVFRSSLLAGLRDKLPKLAPFLAGKFRHMWTRVWQRASLNETSRPVWRSSWTMRGGGQGSRLMMVAFVCSTARSLDIAAREARAEGHASQRVGYQDDQYFKTKVASFQQVEQSVTIALTAAGHQLQQRKCAVWIPALDNVDDAELPQAVKFITDRYTRCRSHLDALGGAAHGSNCTTVTTQGAGLKAVTKRAARAATFVRELTDVVKRQQHTQCFHAAWVVTSRVIAHAFDFDARLVGAARLEPVARHVYDSMIHLITAIAGGMDETAKAQVQLPGRYGGCALRLVAKGLYSHAALVASGISTAQMLNQVLDAMGAPGPVPKSSECSDAENALAEAGIQIATSGSVTFSDAAALAYNATPWKADRPADDIASDESLVQQPLCRRLAGRAFAHISAMQDADLWATAPNRARKTSILSAGGSGSGQMWTMQGLSERRMLHNAHFREAVRLRLGISKAHSGSTCQLVYEASADSR